MKQIHESYVTGFVTIEITGHQPELFFQHCIDHGVFAWNIKKNSATTCQGNIRLYDIKKIKQLRRNSRYKIKFTDKKGLPFLWRRMLRVKEILFALGLSIVLIVILSNILWRVTVTGVTQEIETKIDAQLEHYGIRPGRLLFTMDAPAIIQQKLLQDIPELLWVGIEQKGTTFAIEGIEKIIIEEKKNASPQNLVATKKGVITYMFVASGSPVVTVNDYVEPGDLLVSGVIGQTNEDETNSPNKQYVAAEGTIRAETWYEMDVTIPLEQQVETLTGNQQHKYYLDLNWQQIPIWGFSKITYDQTHEEISEHQLKFFQWNLPIKIIKTTVNEKNIQQVTRTVDEAIEIGITQARADLLLELGQDAEILSNKILHQSIDNGKVKLNLFMIVEEDIMEAEPITQGD